MLLPETKLSLGMSSLFLYIFDINIYILYKLYIDIIKR